MNLKNPIVKLQDELEISNCGIEALQCVFYQASKNIINHYCLQINDLQIELKELEFYFFDCEKHSDIYVHCNEIQKNTSGFLYVHDSWGNYGGLDLTFGNKKYYGGILIRGIKIDDRYISGPAKSRNYIISKLELDDKIDSYKSLQKYFYDSKNKIYLVKKENILDDTKILHSTRIGLSDKDDKYRQVLYRFVDNEYLDALPKLFDANKKAKMEQTRTKGISFSSGIYNDKKFASSQSGKQEIKNIKSDKQLCDYVNKFKEICTKN